MYTRVKCNGLSEHPLPLIIRTIIVVCVRPNLSMLYDGVEHRASFAVGPSVHNRSIATDEYATVALQPHIALVVEVSGVQARVGLHRCFTEYFPLILLCDFGG